MLYNTLCVPFVTYCNVVWTNTYPSTTNRIQLLLKRAVWAISLKNHKENSEKLFHITNNLNFLQFNQYTACIFVFKQLTNKLSSIFKFYYKRNSNSRRRNCILCNKAKTNILFAYIICSDPRMWNKLDQDGFDLNITSLTLFKKHLKKIFNK